MRTTLDLDEKLVEEVVAVTGEKNKGRAVNQALLAFVRRRRLEALKAMAGRIELDDTLQDLEALEIKEMTRSQW